jgi:hypothetical protein
MAFPRIKELLAAELESTGYEGEGVDRLQAIMDEVIATESELAAPSQDDGLLQELETLKGDLERIKTEFKNRFMTGGKSVEEIPDPEPEQESGSEETEKPITIDEYLKGGK